MWRRFIHRSSLRTRTALIVWVRVFVAQPGRGARPAAGPVACGGLWVIAAVESSIHAVIYVAHLKLVTHNPSWAAWWRRGERPGGRPYELSTDGRVACGGLAVTAIDSSSSAVMYVFRTPAAPVI